MSSSARVCWNYKSLLLKVLSAVVVLLALFFYICVCNKVFSFMKYIWFEAVWLVKNKPPLTQLLFSFCYVVQIKFTQAHSQHLWSFELKIIFVAKLILYAIYISILTNTVEFNSCKVKFSFAKCLKSLQCNSEIVKPLKSNNFRSIHDLSNSHLSPVSKH